MNRYQIFKNELIDLNLRNFILNTENKYKKLFENLWKKRCRDYKKITADHIKKNGVVMGQCLSAVGWVQILFLIKKKGL